MSRPRSFTVDWHGTPRRPHLRPSVWDPVKNKMTRPRIDLGRPDLKQDNPEDRKEARRVAKKEWRRIEKTFRYVGQQAAVPNPTVRSLESPFFSVLEALQTVGIVDNIKSAWNAHILVDLGDRRVESGLSVPFLVEWIEGLATRPSARGRPPGAIHVRQVASALRRLLDIAKARGWAQLTANPMRDPEVVQALRQYAPLKRGGSGKVAFWKERESFEAVLALPWDDIWFGLLLGAVLSGLRPGEQHGLTFERLKIRQCEPIPHAQIHQQVVNARGGKPVRIQLNKGGEPVLKTQSSSRDLPLHPLFVTWLRWWEAEGWEAVFGRPPCGADLVFPSRRGSQKGKLWRPSAAAKLRLMLERGGLESAFVLPGGKKVKVTWNALRRTLSSWLRAQRVRPEVIRAIIGHRQRSVLDEHYAEPSLEEMAEAIATLHLVLPNRPGVASSQLETSPESSPVSTAGWLPIQTTSCNNRLIADSPSVLLDHRHQGGKPLAAGELGRPPGADVRRDRGRHPPVVRHGGRGPGRGADRGQRVRGGDDVPGRDSGHGGAVITTEAQ